MSKKEQVTYTTFVKTANELKADGVNPSVRSVRGRIGGSNSTLLDYLRRWQADNALASTVEEGIPDTLKQALLAEFGRRAAAAREKLEAQLAQEGQQTKEANELLAEAEAQLAELQTQHQTEKDQTTAKILELEKQLAATTERAAELQNQIEKLEHHLKESITAQEFARTEAAKCKLQLERADKDTDKAERQLKELEAKFTELQQRAHQAEIKTAVAEARVGELEKRVAKT